MPHSFLKIVCIEGMLTAIKRKKLVCYAFAKAELPKSSFMILFKRNYS